jgi:hypothetical protein
VDRSSREPHRTEASLSEFLDGSFMAFISKLADFPANSRL